MKVLLPLTTTISSLSPMSVRDETFRRVDSPQMPSHWSGEGFAFATSKADRASTHYFEREKYFYLTEKLLKTIKDGSKIFVLKSSVPVSQTAIENVLHSLRRIGDVSVLWVCEQDAAHAAGTVEIFSDNLYRGFVGAFSTDDGMNDIDMQSWLSICEATWNLHTSIHGTPVETGEEHRRPSQQPTELPSWFDPDLYLLANPDVAEAGMNAGEHYLQFGWREGRATRL